MYKYLSIYMGRLLLSQKAWDELQTLFQTMIATGKSQSILHREQGQVSRILLRTRIPEFRIPRRLSEDECLLWIEKIPSFEQNQRCVSLLYLGMRDFRREQDNVDEHESSPEVDHEINAIVFGYAWTHPDYRGQGWSKWLRLWTIAYAEQVGIPYVISLPFEGALSNPLLDSLAFSYEGATRYLSIGDLDIKTYLSLHLTRK